MSRALNLQTLIPETGDITVTREQMTVLMLESHKKAINSAEEIMALREIAKLHSLYEQKPLVQINHNTLHIEQNSKKLETMTDEQLLEMAGQHPHLFSSPLDTVKVIPQIEGECEKVGKRKKRRKVNE